MTRRKLIFLVACGICAFIVCIQLQRFTTTTQSIANDVDQREKTEYPTLMGQRQHPKKKAEQHFYVGWNRSISSSTTLPHLIVRDSSSSATPLSPSPWIQASGKSSLVDCNAIEEASAALESWWWLPTNPKQTEWISNALQGIVPSEFIHLQKPPRQQGKYKNATIRRKQQVFFNKTCPITRQVRIIPNDKCSHWILQTYDEYRRPKTQGGDEFYVTYTAGSDAYDATGFANHQHHPHAIAQITDLQNGSYKLKFIENPLYHRKNRIFLQGKNGTLTVIFQYTCGIGQLDPPTKNTWSTGGATVGSYSTQISLVPPIAPFISPRLRRDKKHRSYLDEHTSFLDVIAIGDSMMRQFVNPLFLRIPNIGKPLNTTTVSEWKSIIQSRIEEQQDQQNNSSKNKPTVLLLSSHAWDLLSSNGDGDSKFSNHQEALRELLVFIETDYPNSKVYWKSPSALHIHVPHLAFQQQQVSVSKNKFGFFNRIRYMSESRSYKLYQVQKRIISSEFPSVKFLDVYDASFTAADSTFKGDGRHYRPHWNQMVVDWFLRSSPADQIWRHYTDTLIPYTSSNISTIKMDCDTMSKSWVNLVNGILLSTVSNRQIIWNDEDACHASSLLYLLSPRWKMALQRTQQNDASTEVVGKGHYRSSSLIQENTELLSLDELRDLAKVENGPDLRYTNILYSEGDDYLFGMIMYDVFGYPSLPSTPSFFEGPQPGTGTEGGSWEGRSRYLLPSESILVALDNVDGLHLEVQNIDEILQNITNAHSPLPCHILVLSSSQQGQEDDGNNMVYSSPSAAVDCTIVPVHPELRGNAEDENNLAFLNSFSFLAMVANLEIDAYISVCDGHDEVHSWKKGLLAYLQSRIARAKGILPIEPIPSFCYSLKFNYQ